MFANLDEKELKIVIDAMEVKNYKPKQVIIKQRDDGNEMFLIGEGKLDWHRVMKLGERPTFLKNYEPGDVFGELALLYNAPRAATITAVTDSTLYSLDRSTFNTVVRKKNGPCAKKVNPCAKKMTPVQKKWPPVQKKWPLCKKNEPRNKKLSVKNFIFFVGKLNMIDFNIFKMLKLVFTCESCAISITV